MSENVIIGSSIAVTTMDFVLIVIYLSDTLFSKVSGFFAK